MAQVAAAAAKYCPCSRELALVNASRPPCAAPRVFARSGFLKSLLLKRRAPSMRYCGAFSELLDVLLARGGGGQSNHVRAANNAGYPVLP